MEINTKDFIIILLFLIYILSVIITSALKNNPNRLCKSGDIYCKHRYGDKSYCAFQNSIPTCYDEQYNNTGDACTCIRYEQEKDSPMFYVCVCMFILLVILGILAIPGPKPIETQLRFMFE